MYHLFEPQRLVEMEYDVSARLRSASHVWDLHQSRSQTSRCNGVNVSPPPAY